MLTFAFDVQLNDNEDWIPENTQVQIANVTKQIEGFTPVIVTNARTYKGKPIKTNVIEYFSNGSFKEYM